MVEFVATEGLVVAPEKRRRRELRWTPESTQLCPNCLEHWHPESFKRWYCSLRCSSEAEAVRYARKKDLEYEGREVPEDVLYAIKINIAHALGGGYDKHARRIDDETREAVIKRDSGVCVTCGAPGEEIDHIDGPSSTLENLRLLCRAHHHEITDARLRPVSDVATMARRDALVERRLSDEPLRPCDAADWDVTRTEWRRRHLIERPVGT